MKYYTKVYNSEQQDPTKSYTTYFMFNQPTHHQPFAKGKYKQGDLLKKTSSLGCKYPILATCISKTAKMVDCYSARYFFNRTD